MCAHDSLSWIKFWVSEKCGNTRKFMPCITVMNICRTVHAHKSLNETFCLKRCHWTWNCILQASVHREKQDPPSYVALSLTFLDHQVGFSSPPSFALFKVFFKTLNICKIFFILLFLSLPSPPPTLCCPLLLLSWDFRQRKKPISFWRALKVIFQRVSRELE